MRDLPWSVAVIANRVVVRGHFHTAPVKAALDAGFRGLVSSARYNATAWGAQHVPPYEDFVKASTPRRAGSHRVAQLPRRRAAMSSLPGSHAKPPQPHPPSLPASLALALPFPCFQVATWLLAILRPTDEGAAPSSPEALALLTNFAQGLLHPDLPAPPPVAAMRSVTTLIPHYQVRLELPDTYDSASCKSDRAS
jgi:hypothetical protein